MQAADIVVGYTQQMMLGLSPFERLLCQTAGALFMTLSVAARPWTYLIPSPETVRRFARWMTRPVFRLAGKFDSRDPSAIWEFFSGCVWLWFAIWMTVGKVTASGPSLYHALQQNYSVATLAVFTFFVGMLQHAALFSDMYGYRMAMSVMSTALWLLMFLFLLLKFGLVMVTGIFAAAVLASVITLVKFHDAGGGDGPAKDVA